ncbi:arrestin domain-containing protein 3 [Amyelois transitella]|uniref:arrestin domain-containing protein 3 n=1 Tax=Amyelois transitella TaxID=680683 RepID=UPI00067B1266|nr:arrestin domain-containing protein 3 [Amyelois transitella]
MTWENCTVTLNSDSTGRVYAGDVVTGTVTLEFAKEKFIENVDFQILGFGEAQWTRSKPTAPYIKICSEKKKLLHINMDVFGNTFRRVINPGIYNFPFHFALPGDLPSTFESSIAKVYYYIKIEMKGMFKPKKTVPFIVFGNVNLNHIEEFLDPTTHIFQKICWNSKYLSVSLKTYEGFASKQNIPLRLRIKNEEKVIINKIKVYLIQKLQYSISDGYTAEERNLYHVEFNKISNTTSETCNFSMDVPCVPPSTLYTTDAMIIISYVLRVEVIFLFHSTLRQDIPVTIATVPVIHNEF